MTGKAVLLRDTSHRWGPWADAACALVLPVSIVAALFLFPFVRDPFQLPYGADTAGYIWRATAVHAGGIQALHAVPKALGARPTQPIVSATIWGLFGTTPLTLAWFSPALMAATIALAAGALAADGLGEPRRRSGAYAVGVGASAFVAWTAVGYATNLMVDPIVLALMVVTILVTFTRGSRVAGALLLIGAALTHYMFAFAVVVLLGAFTLVLALGRRLPERLRPPADAVPRLATMLGMGVAGSLLALGLCPELPVRIPQIKLDNRKVLLRLPALSLPATMPVAALGGVLRLRSGPTAERWLTGLLLLWAAMVPASLAAWYLLHLPIPPNRWASFALAIPFLCVAAAATLGNPLRRRGILGKAAASALLLVAVGGLVSGGASVWWTPQHGLLTGRDVEEISTVVNYVRTLPPDTRFVLTYPPPFRIGVVNRVLAALPADLVPRVSPRPVVLDWNLPDLGISARSNSVVLSVAAIDPRHTSPPGLVLGPGVVLLQGPAPTAPIVAGALPRAPGVMGFAALLLASLATLGLAGSGWASLLRIHRLGRTALAPAFGLAAIGPIGLLASRAGLPFDRTGSATLVAIVAGSGWFVQLLVRRRARAQAETPALDEVRPIQSTELPDSSKGP